MYSVLLKSDLTVKNTADSGAGFPFDRTLKKKYNKLAEGPSQIMGETR